MIITWQLWFPWQPFMKKANFYRNIKDNILIKYMIFYENCMATLVAMATVHEKIQMAFPMKQLSQF